MFDVTFSNRLEPLAARLVGRIGDAPASVFDEHVVVVPSAAMRHHLTLELARSHGICAAVRFEYLAQWLWRQVAAFDPAVGRSSPFEAEPLAWRIWGEFEEPGWTASHPRLSEWLARADPAMRFELALEVAGLLGQYATYRSDWLEAWAAGRAADLGAAADSALADQAWQAELWRRVAARLAIEGDANPLRRFAQALAAAGPWHRLPREVHVFCQPSIAPLHLEALAALGSRVDVRLYALNPCREYWFDVVDRKRLAYLSARGLRDHHDEGHRLLAAWGGQAQSQLGLLVDRLDATVEHADFVHAGRATMLGLLQDSVLALDDPAPGSARPAAGDRLIEVHSCHSLGRELEALHDRLLALFREHADLAPADVLVVVPDLESAAPLVDAVFGTVPGSRSIPYRITGRGRTRVNGAARALLDALALAQSRLLVNDVVGLLQSPPVARRFDLDDGGLRTVRAWLREAGVHWGLDSAHRASLGLPPSNLHSLADGLDRLFLGYALPSRTDAPFGDLLPSGDAEGTEALALGALSRFVESIEATREATARPRRAAEWPAVFARVLADFADPDVSPEDFREVEQAIERVAQDMSAVGAERRVPLDVALAALARALDEPARGGVPTGAVTFTSMASLRNLPFRVVCAIGLDDGAFPSGVRPAEFDLLALTPRPGDRQRRVDERNLFLDLVLAARGWLHLSYTGHSARDNSTMPPSVLVAELLDWLARVVAPDPADPAAVALARQGFVVEHPLQPFSESAFLDGSDERTRSHDADYADALRARAAAPPGSVARGAAGRSPSDQADDDDENDVVADAAPPLFTAPLAVPAQAWDDVTIEQLVRFFRAPCRYLLERRLGIALPRSEEELQDDEPFLPDVPARSALAERLLPHLLAGADDEEVRALALAGREMPAGALGRGALESELAGLRSFAGRVRSRHDVPCLPPHTVALDLAGGGRAWRLAGAFSDLRASGLIRFRYDDARATDYLASWLHHLLLCASPAPGAECRTAWVLRDTTLEYGPCPDARDLLADLLSLYGQGLREPLYFFPKTAWAWLERDESRSEAANRWRASEHNRFAEGADVAVRLALRGLADPMEDEGFEKFADCARRVFGPLRQCLAQGSAS